MDDWYNQLTISVPIRGLFNLTERIRNDEKRKTNFKVSVPIRGLFNLTSGEEGAYHERLVFSFRPHQGII